MACVGGGGEGFFEGGVEPEGDHGVVAGGALVFELGEVAVGLSFVPIIAVRVVAFTNKVVGDGGDGEEIGFAVGACTVAVFWGGVVDGAEGALAFEGAVDFGDAADVA